MQIYVVQPGDTLTGIAQRFGVSYADLLSLNQLSNPESLLVGQAILIPALPPPPLRYTVISGDTLYGIARLFNTTVTAVAQANNITNPNLILPGMVLTIPGWTQTPYTVKAGDTIWNIAARFGVTVEQVIKVNRIADPTRIYPGQVLIIPQLIPVVIKPTIETLGYFHLGSPNALSRTWSTLQSYLTYAALFQFQVVSDGSIVSPTGIEQTITLAKQNRIQPLMVITNWGATGTFESDLAHDILSSDAARANVVQNVETLLKQYGFAGLNVDFENMLPGDRPLYTAFIAALVSALKPLGYSVSLAAPPKFADFPNAAWVGAFDYAALGRLVDFIFLMTYEWGWIGGPPMAVAPINLVRRALTYATSLIPPEKIIQGIPLYGYNWTLPDTPENLATAVDLVSVYNLGVRYNVAINFDPVAQSPWFRYTDDQGVLHEVWFEDARSMTAKYQAAKDFHLRGVGFWSYLNEPYGFPQNWAILGDTFTILKY